MTQLRADVAAMLRAGATHAQIIEQLGVSSHTIVRTRRALNIPVPPGRAKRTSAELAALDDQAVTMLQGGATYEEIHRLLGLGHNRVSDLRKQHKIPVPHRDRNATQRLTVDEQFARYAIPTSTGGHLLWTGPHSGRGLDLIASGRKHNARHVAFAKHHGRDPDGRVRRTCELPDCIAGAHHTDHRIRAAHARADAAYHLIFGPDA
ncbi:hypothetical protein [Streptomyces sp. NPDC057877]|uniref:hypothetical protein n=1 Tax=Streptomyces sp. NPDC057877 TaxID=3346269 RepID=UPI0036A98A9F